MPVRMSEAEFEAMIQSRNTNLNPKQIENDIHEINDTVQSTKRLAKRLFWWYIGGKYFPLIVLLGLVALWVWPLYLAAGVVWIAYRSVKHIITEWSLLEIVFALTMLGFAAMLYDIFA